jgi:hypothetical protein
MKKYRSLRELQQKTQTQKEKAPKAVKEKRVSPLRQEMRVRARTLDLHKVYSKSSFKLHV